MREARWSGCLLIGGAVTFWTSWVLMPGVGITDAALILDLVSQSRHSVLISSVLQLCSAALLAVALPGLAWAFSKKRTPWISVGVILLSLGVCGDAADTIFHMMAYEMVGPGAERAQMVPVYQRMQEFDLLFLLPMIFAFFLGGLSLAVGIARAGLVSWWNPGLYGVALAVGILGAQIVRALGQSGRVVGLMVLALVSVSLAWLGIALTRVSVE